MWQNLIVLLIVGSAFGYIGWAIYRSILGAASACSGRGCGGCGCGSKQSAEGGNLIQLTSGEPTDDAVTSPDETSAVSSQRM